MHHQRNLEILQCPKLRRGGATVMEHAAVLILLMMVIVPHGDAQTPPSPCPQIFRYESDGYGWYGVLEVPDSSGPVLNVRIKMTVGAQLQGSYYGKIDLFENKAELQSKLAQGLPIKYKVDFPLSRPLPYLTSVEFNDRIICSGPAGNGYLSSINLHHTLDTGNRGNFQRPFVRPTQRPYEDINNQQSFTRPTQRPYEDVTSSAVQSYNRPSQVSYYNEYTTASPSNQFVQPYIGDGSNTPRPIVNPEPSYEYTTKVTPPRIDVNAGISCGTRDDGTIPLIVGGLKPRREEWPWLAALYKRKAGVLEFICGSSLVSDRLIITAAHCVTDENKREINHEKIVLRLGVYNIDDWTDDNAIVRDINQIKISAYYQEFQFSNDIAVLVMSETVTFSQYIRPVCLWQGSDSQDEVVGKEGMVVGWGKDEDGDRISAEPKMISVPIVSTVTCRGSNPAFFKLTSDKTLCAGSKKGTGPCRGDSGGGMYMERNGRWYIRGIVSSALKGEQNSCDLYQYVVYTDCAKYVSWINST